MATEKKKVEKKSGKKTAQKVTAIKAVKSSALVIKVPQGGQVIRSFNLTPALPENGKVANWLLVDPAKPNKDIDSMRISFSVNSSELEQEFERAILEVNIQQNPSDNGVWRFMGTGIAVNPKYSDVHHDVAVEVVNQGLTLLVQVQVIGMTSETIEFSYLAAFTDALTRQVTIYESQDPDIKPGRP